MCAFIQGGFKGKDHGWLQKEGWTALFKCSTNGVQMDIPSVSYSLHLYIPNKHKNNVVIFSFIS